MISDVDSKKEKQRARELRKTKWWRQKCSQGLCYYCNHRFPPYELTMDHLIPLSKGGRSIKSNLVAACKECNNKKKYLLPFEWKEYIECLSSTDEDTL